MVVEGGLAQVFAALGNATRLEILDRLAEGDASCGELVERFEISQQAVSKHIAVLKRAGLVRQHQVGRTRRCELVPRPLDEADRWLRAHRALWNGRFTELDRYLAEARTDE